MDGENNGGKPYEQRDDLGVALFLEPPRSLQSTRDFMTNLKLVPTSSCCRIFAMKYHRFTEKFGAKQESKFVDMLCTDIWPCSLRCDYICKDWVNCSATFSTL